MSRSDREPSSVSISVGGNNTGVILVGGNSTIIMNKKTGRETVVTGEESAKFVDALKQLRTRVESEAPPKQQKAALGQVDDLQSALSNSNLDRVERIRDWFAKHLPGLLGAVTTVFVDPIVGKVVEAAGEIAAEAFRKRFGAH